MVPATKLQSLYNKLYVQLRKYIWDFKTVEELADFEIAVYRRFPDKEDIEKTFRRLRTDVVKSDIYQDDEDLKYAIEDFEEQLDDTDQFYADLVTFREVVETNDDQEESEEWSEDEESEAGWLSPEETDEDTEERFGEEESDEEDTEQ